MSEKSTSAILVPPFQVGDVVQLKSGSVKMTVIGSADFTVAAWESNGTVHKFSAEHAAFEKVK